jgi:PPE-repeat protein
MIAGDFAANTPQANYYTLIAGDHAASTEAAAAAYQALSDALAAEIAVMGANTAMTAAEGWKGLGGTAMTFTADMFAAAMSLAVGWLNEAAAAATDIASAYHSAETGMIPGPVSDANRATQAGLVATNWFGQHNAPIHALDAEYLHHWMQNASWMGIFQAAVTAALAVLATPPPVAPVTANPAVAAAAAAQVAVDPAINALSQGTQSMTEAVGGAQVSEAASPATASSQLMQTALPAIMSSVGQVPQMLSQAPQAISSLPQMLGQGAGQFSGLLGPLSGATALGSTPAEIAPLANLGAAPGTAAGLSPALSGGMSAAAGPANGVMSAFTKPVNSFSAPNQPKLPGAWKVPEEGPLPAPVSGSPGVGSGGLYGAPAVAREGTAGQGVKTPARTLQLTGRGTANRGDDPQN